jgi:hypothetical protein
LKEADFKWIVLYIYMILLKKLPFLLQSCFRSVKLSSELPLVFAQSTDDDL